MSRKERLIEELKKEHARLPEHDVFGDCNHVEQYEPIYTYLRTGVKHPGNNYHWDLYMMVLEDLDSVYEDYGIE